MLLHQRIICFQSALALRSRWSRPAAQRGFSLIEVSVVTAIVLLLAIIAIPAIGSYVVENKVPKVGEELARFVVQTKVNASAGGATPYSGIDTLNLATRVGQSGVFSVSGSGASTAVKHGLGTEGTVTIAETGAGAGFSITLSNVNDAACPGIASVMQRVADTITVAPNEGAAVVLKDTTLAYNALSAEANCAQGDVNSFVFSVS